MLATKPPWRATKRSWSWVGGSLSCPRNRRDDRGEARQRLVPGERDDFPVASAKNPPLQSPGATTTLLCLARPQPNNPRLVPFPPHPHASIRVANHGVTHDPRPN